MKWEKGGRREGRMGVKESIFVLPVLKARLAPTAAKEVE